VEECGLSSVLSWAPWGLPAQLNSPAHVVAGSLLQRQGPAMCLHEEQAENEAPRGQDTGQAAMDREKPR
jgi:hypothetical protein